MESSSRGSHCMRAGRERVAPLQYEARPQLAVASQTAVKQRGRDHVNRVRRKACSSEHTSILCTSNTTDIVTAMLPVYPTSLPVDIGAEHSCTRRCYSHACASPSTALTAGDFAAASSNTRCFPAAVMTRWNAFNHKPLPSADTASKLSIMRPQRMLKHRSLGLAAAAAFLSAFVCFPRQICTVGVIGRDRDGE